MKEITIEVPDKKVDFFVELLDQLGVQIIKIQEARQDETPPIVKFWLQQGYEVKVMKEVKNLTLNKETIDIILNS